METAQILELFDAQMRRDPPVEEGSVIDRSGGLVRLLGDRSWILYSKLSHETAPEVVQRETAFFRRRGKEVEWKVFGHDSPAELGQLLANLGYSADSAETIMVFDLESPSGLPPNDPDIEVGRVVDPSTLAEAVDISRAAFYPEEGWKLEDYVYRLGDPTFGLFLARARGKAVAAGRLELPEGKSFASLWGGGTLPEYRGQGIYRSLVRARAQLARGRGFRFLTADARESSRPILEQMGFAPITTATGWVLRP